MRFKTSTLFSLLSVLLIPQKFFAQNQLKSFEWRDHLSYEIAYSATWQGSTLYCASAQNIFSYNANDNSFSRHGKVQGFTDIEPIIVKNNPYNNTLFIVYKNANIDLVVNGVIYNLPDILRKQGISNKTVNSVYFNNQFAYIATSFGIVVLDTDKKEFKDTYLIGNNGTELNVNEVTLDNTYIYAATSTGVRYAPVIGVNLANYQNWSVFTSLPLGNFSSIVNFNNAIYADYSIFDSSIPATYFKDTIYSFNTGVWSVFANKSLGYIATKLIVSTNQNRLFVLSPVNFEVWNNSLNLIYSDYGGWVPVGGYANIREVTNDPSNANIYWISDAIFGLIKCNATSGPSSYSKYRIDGPNTCNANEVKLKDGKIIVAPAFLGDFSFANYLQEGVYTYNDGDWKHVKKFISPPNSFFDLNCVTFDPDDKTHYYGGSFLNGVQEIRNDSVVGFFDNTNTTMPTINSSDNSVRVSSVKVDDDGNLWVAHSCENLPTPLTVRKPDGTWKSFSFFGILGNNVGTKRLLVDKNKQVWVLLPGQGICVYKHDGSYSSPTTANSKRLNNVTGSGALASLNVYSIAEDIEDDIWVGSDKGIMVFYNPENVISGNSDAQQIFITQDGQTQILLETELVSAIAVDGGNNKWIGTRNGGVYCLSPDGQKQLYHFTIDNSPLYSNSILDITIDPKTGEVFIATTKGMLSFQNIIIEGFEKFEEVYSYPNPVKPDYSGPILIHGMINGAVVKIVDVAGNLVYETKSEGGQAVWYGKNMKGVRVTSGVYVVFAATKDGVEKAVTKILLLN